MFRRRKPPREVDLTDGAFAQWLRACRPPLPWFLTLPSDQREALARLGDAYTADLLSAAGAASTSQGARDALRHLIDPAGAEERLLAGLAAAAASKARARLAQEAPQQPAAPYGKPATMAGVVGRREAAEGARRVTEAASKSFLGQPGEVAR